MPSAPSPLLIVGLGRLGGALARALEGAGLPVRVVRGRSARALPRPFRPPTPAELLGAKLCFLCVPDHAVSQVARAMQRRIGPTCALVHCAGALTLDALGAGPRPRGSFHPLCAISAPSDPLAGHAVAVAASTLALERRLRRLARELALRPLRVREDRRATYHAGAVLSAGALVALASFGAEAFGKAGISERDALRAAVPLMRSALRGIERRGLAGGLTGPVVRGDVEVVARHLDGLPGDGAELYRLLSLRAWRIARERLDPAAAAALRRLLEGARIVRRG